MISTDNLCMSCMREIGEEKQCPYCGYHADSPQISPYLPVRTVVANRYLVGKLLSYNGEGATYIGWDLVDKKAVNIREFIPDSISMRTTNDLTLRIMAGSEATFRDCNQSFLELWNKLARLRGLSALISVTDVVEDFGTSYAIYDYVEGITLREYLLNSKTGYIPWDKARSLLMPILSSLGTLHSSGIIHRGISPTTLVIGTDGKVRISGFCIWQARTARGDLNAQLFPGYAAIEQYGFEGQQGAWTDIYSFGAVLYRTLIGSDPIEATQRVTNDRLMVPGKFAEQLPAYVINGLINALQILPEDRTRTVEQLRAELSASPIAAAASEQYTQRRPAVIPNSLQGTAPIPGASVPARSGSTQRPAPQKKKRDEKSVAVLAGVISVVAGLLIFLVLALTVFRDEFKFFSPSSEPSAVSTTQGEPVAVPGFEGKSFFDIENNPVFTQHFSFNPVYEYSNDIGDGYVISQSVPEGTQVPAGTRITLVVSKGAQEVALPDVCGLTYEEAYDTLKGLGFECQRQDVTSAAGDYLPGQVVSVSGIPEKEYKVGYTFILKVLVDEGSTQYGGIAAATDAAPHTVIPITTVPYTEQVQGE